MSKEKRDREEDRISAENISQGRGDDIRDQNRRRTSSRLWTPYGDPAKERGSSHEEIKADSEVQEELRKRVEEALKRLTVADIVIEMVINLSSLAYQKMGIPKDVNAEYKDMEQARLAIDCIDAIVRILSERLPAERVQPLTGTLDNLKLNYAKEI